MKFRLIERFFVSLFIAIPIVITLVALHRFLADRLPAQISSPPHGAGDWAAWFGAIGTIAAAGVALWIAGQQERTRRRIELAQANVVAAKLAPKLGSAYLGVGNFLLKMAFVEADALPPDTNEVVKSLLERPPLQVDVSDLVALAGLGDGNATKLAHVVGLLDALREKVVLHANDYSTINETRAEIWRREAQDIADRIYVIQIAFNDAAKIHAPLPSLKELHGISD